MQIENKKSVGMELLHLLVLQEAAGEGEALTCVANAGMGSSRRWAGWWVAQGSPKGHLGLVGAASSANPMECSLLFLWIPVGTALRVCSPKSLSGDTPGIRNLPLVWVLGSRLASAPWEWGAGTQGGKRGGFSSPPRIPGDNS